MSNETLRYRIVPARPEAHLFEVTLEVPQPAVDGQVVSMASWIPGSYMVRDFARNVVAITATCGDAPLAVEKLDKQTWRCAPCTGPLSVRYEVYCWDLSVRSAHLDTTHGYFNGTSVFLRVHGQEAAPCEVAIEPPAGEAYAHWRVATTLPASGAPPYGFGTYRAADYDELIDHPVEMGEFSLIEFEARGIPHAMAITGRQNADTARLAADLQKVCDHQIGMFRECPTDRYLFLTLAVGDGYGGLEHRSSSSLMCKRSELPPPGLGEPNEDYRNFLGLCSHEYFHSWNVKRIKPARFVPYDLSGEVHTRLLWWFEGVTSYYDELALLRAGLIAPESYLELLGQLITRVLRTPGRKRQTVLESSFDAWTKLYKADENAPNAIISYYAKGALVALALDLTLRRESDGKVSLDDVMRALWQAFGKTGQGVGEDELEAFIVQTTGIALGPFFDRALRTTEDLPLPELLAEVGIGFHLRPATGDGDKGGKPAEKTAPVDFGIRLAADSTEARIQAAIEDRPAMRAGLSAGDTLVALDGIRVTRANFDALLATKRPGDTVQVHAFRRDELLAVTVDLPAPPEDTCWLTIDEVDEATLKRRTAWLGG